MTEALAPIRLESAEQLTERGDVQGAPPLDAATLDRHASHATWIMARPGCWYLAAIRRSGPASSGVPGAVSAARGTGPTTTASPSISTPCSSW